MPYVKKKTGFLTPAEKELVDYYEIQWHLNHRVPTVEEVTNHLRNLFTKKYGTPNKIKQTSVNYYLQRYPVKKALKDRGIEWEQHSQAELTDGQKAAALTVSNFADERPIKDKLDALGISTTQYYAWLKDPVFRNFVNGQADDNLKSIRPAAITEFTKKIQGGDWQAIKFYLENTGTLASDDATPTEQLLKFIIEIIQKHVKDPDVMLAIAQDILSAGGSRNLTASKSLELEGEFYSEEDLKQAERMIGFG